MTAGNPPTGTGSTMDGSVTWTHTGGTDVTFYRVGLNLTNPAAGRDNNVIVLFQHNQGGLAYVRA